MTKVPWPIRRIHNSPSLFETSRRLDFSLFWWRESYYTTVYPSFMIIAFSLLILLHLALYVSTHKQSIMIFILSNLNKICVSSHPISCSTIFTNFTSCHTIFSALWVPLHRVWIVSHYSWIAFVSFVSEFWHYIMMGIILKHVKHGERLFCLTLGIFWC